MFRGKRGCLGRRQAGWVVAITVALGWSLLAEAGVSLKKAPDKITVEIDGTLFTELHFGTNASRPYLYPIIGPDGARMTRHWPMEQLAGEDHDHPHHRSFWWAHGEMNAQDFWSESPKAGRTVQTELIEATATGTGAIIRTRNRYVALDGKVVATDERALRIPYRKDDRMIDFEITVHASSGELKLGDTKEGTMAIRVAESMRVVKDKKPGEGHIVNSEGLRDGETWGKRAKWCDYFGPVDGKTVGIAIFDHPTNPRHPTWWHVRDYGLFAANPFGIHDFEKKAAGEGNLIVPANGKITFRYRFYFHRGDEKAGLVAERYQEYVTSQP